MKQNENSGNQVFHTAAMLATAVLSAGLTMTAPLAHATIDMMDEIIVTARRTDEVIQNVPISMTVFSQEVLSERNVTNGVDLANYTPSLSVNTRFGSEQASFAIRGFTQELRTTASVAVYFADVVAPRGSGNVTAGDGAGPGAFFDLQNVQVLKGPQGTLFGRNTTGGAIQLVPQEPTTELEGYLEESLGNYNMRRTQGVINVPLSDMARARFGVDYQKRDGYLTNVSGIGPNHLANVDYISGRASLILDLPASVQNYTILTYTDSENHGSIEKIFACNPNGLLAPVTAICNTSLARQGNGLYDVLTSDVFDPVSKLKQWQAINTTTWEVTDDFSVKNILSYAGLEQTFVNSNFGSDFILPDSVAVKGSNGLPLHLTLFPSGQEGNLPTSSQNTFVEELRFSGTALDQQLTWQTGLYFEHSLPGGHWAGQASPGLLACDPEDTGSDPNTWNCFDYIGSQTGEVFRGSVERQQAKVEYENKAIYAQGTYDISDEWRATLGLRYTVDRTRAKSQRVTYIGFPIDGLGSFDPAQTRCSFSETSLSDGCLYHQDQNSEAPTWLIGVDYLPTTDVMLYAKYARGYRQGSVVTTSLTGLDSYKPEQVDAYEIGTKTSFRGPVPGSFNISVFYNELKDQQIQWGYFPLGGGSATTAIVNAGKSTIQGFEVETTLRLLDDLMFNLSYSYLDTHLDTLEEPAPQPKWISVPTAVEGGHLTFSPRHNVTTGLSYNLPLPAEVGKVSAGVSYTFTDSQISSATSDLGTLPAHRLLNLNLGWKAIYGSGFDASLFMTNALGEKYYSYVTGMYNSFGPEFGVPGEPKMWGTRVKYNFD